MAAKLPAKITDYTPMQAQSTFTKAEQKAFKEFHKYVNDRVKDNIMWYWELGQRVAKLHKAASDDSEIYGKHFIDRLGVALGQRNGRQLRNAMKVCETFNTKTAFNNYVKMRGEAGNMLAWSHMVHLAHIGDDEMRMQLAATALERCWTVEELFGRVKELAGRKTRGTGRPTKTKIPASAKAALAHMQAQAAKFSENVNDAWTGDAFDLVKEVEELPADSLTDQFLEGVQATREKVSQMRKDATELEKALAKAESKIEKRIAAQKEAEAEVTAAAQEEEAEEVTESDAELAAASAAELMDQATEKNEEGDDCVDCGALNNLQERQKRATDRLNRRKGGAKRKGRVGVNR